MPAFDAVGFCFRVAGLMDRLFSIAKLDTIPILAASRDIIFGCWVVVCVVGGGVGVGR